MAYHIIISFMVMSRVSDLEFPLIIFKPLCIETKRAANSFRTSSSALCPIWGINPIVVVTTPIATKSDISIST
jgi:hypothetical protein